MEKKNIALAVVLSFVTCGIYGFYWLYTMTEDVHRLVGRQTTASGGLVILFSIVSCGIYLLYWFYKMGESITEAKEQRGMRVENSAGILYVILTIFALGVVAEALIQSSINDIIDHDVNNGSMAPTVA
ncbi:MAG: DUF4234 domain-containing protein [Selenomonadaceae bacterium]|nr:DUF4234 domain-containing protein [Selenomonadaceae bacterium]